MRESVCVWMWVVLANVFGSSRFLSPELIAGEAENCESSRAIFGLLLLQELIAALRVAALARYIADEAHSTLQLTEVEWGPVEVVDLQLIQGPHLRLPLTRAIIVLTTQQMLPDTHQRTHRRRRQR